MKVITQLTMLTAAIIISTAFMVQWSYASQFTDAEIATMPEYCQARWGGKDKIAYQNWSQRLGADNFSHIHHFCAGSHFMRMAAIEFSPKKKKSLLQKAINNFDYVLARWPREFSMTSEAATYRQQAQMMLGSIR